MRIANRHRGVFNARWAYDAEEAFFEADRRIRAAARHESAHRISKFLRGDEEYELFLSDLSALERIPPKIRSLRLIRELTLGSSSHEKRRCRGTLKISDISFLSNMPYLRRLNISHLPIHDLSPLSSLASLEELDCSFCPISDLSPICGLYDLRSLNISGTPVAKLDPVTKLPAFKRGNDLDLRFDNTPALRDDPSLGLLMRVKDIKNEEIFLYVEGHHPAFTHPTPPLTDSAINKLSDASVVKFESRQGKIASFNQDPDNSDEIANRTVLIGTLRLHVNSLLFEAKAKQLPEFMVARLKRYEQQIDKSDPLFIMLDAPMAFLRGSVKDKYTLEGLDRGFILGLRKLIQIHRELEKTFATSIVDSLDRPLKDNVTAEDLGEVSNRVQKVVSDVSLHDDLAISTLDTLNALRDYVAAATHNVQKSGATLKIGISAFITTLAALANAASIHLWTSAATGSTFLARIKDLIMTLWNFFA